MTTDKTALDALLPCPFCGGEAQDYGQVEVGGAIQTRIGCQKCGARSPIWGDGNSQQAWNTRPQPSGDAVKALDWCDLMVDEFMRIKSCPNVSDEIKQLCERAIKNTHQHLPVILQRDTLQRKVNELEHAALTQPKEDVEQVEDIVTEAMQDIWNDWCADTGSIPCDFERKGRKTYFQAGKWASNVARQVQCRLAAQGYIGGGWQPIETASIEGCLWVMLGHPDYHVSEVGYYNKRYNVWVDGSDRTLFMPHGPTHWMPLPPAPKKEGE